MRNPISLLLLFLVQYSFAQQQFQLAPPMLKYKSAFFSGATSFEVIFNQPGVKIRYTLNGNEPTENDLLYSTPVPISNKTKVKVKAFGKNFLPSETVSAEFINDGLGISSISFSKPNEFYANSKANILNDNIGGIVNYRNGTWLGYENDTVTIDIHLKKKETINTVLISLLQDENSWIFLPEQILVYYYSDKQKNFTLLGKEQFEHIIPGPKQCTMQEIKPPQKIKTGKLKLILLPLKKIPAWHQGKGNHGWLFIDEIKVY
ncbi:MAG: chitobiase/beta-hexosaminidase C-terminal domain-containing protein [Chitinophagaceae bacterium]